MAYDLEEQEQLDEVKLWWKRNGNKVLILFSAALISYASFQSWKYYQASQSLQASAMYDALTELDFKDVKSVRAASAQIIDKYPSTVYAARAALIAAKANYNSNDAKSAQTQLEWAAAHAKEDSIRSIALLQLAGTQLDAKSYDTALKTLSETHDVAFDGLFADLKGDVYAQQGKKSEALASYKEALEKLSADGRYRRYTERKIDALGS